TDITTPRVCVCVCVCVCIQTHTHTFMHTDYTQGLGPCCYLFPTEQRSLRVINRSAFETHLEREALFVSVCVHVCVCVRVCVCVLLTSGKLLIWLRGNFPSLVVTTMTIAILRRNVELPGEVRMFRLRVKSSLSVLRTAVMSSFTSSRLMMSSTRAELMFTLAAWPFALSLVQGAGKCVAWWQRRGALTLAVATTGDLSTCTRD
uniref:Uncharacterized protein n=1 Tax=Myripristis murdjan TaxID=586833 RepID=A0A668ASL8_9TELE